MIAFSILSRYRQPVSDSSLKTLVRTLVPRGLRNSLRSPTKSAQWLWENISFSLGQTKTLELLGWPLLCHPQAYRIFHQLQIEDPEQAAEFENFFRYCSQSTVLLDVGAHFGIFSLAAAHLGGRAIAVDPSPAAIKMTRSLADLNGLSDRIRVVQATVSDHCGELAMLNSGIYSDGYFKAVEGRPRGELTRTQALTIDQLAANFGEPTAIKIDVEGHEAAALRGGRETILRAKPRLFLEFHNEMVAADGGDPNAAVDELFGLGYGAFDLGGHPISRAEILGARIIRFVGAPSSAVKA